MEYSRRPGSAHGVHSRTTAKALGGGGGGGGGWLGTAPSRRWAHLIAWTCERGPVSREQWVEKSREPFFTSKRAGTNALELFGQK